MYPPIEPNEQLEEPEEPQAQEKKLDEEELKKKLETLLKYARDDDRFVREEYVRNWKRLEYYWNNILDIFLDPITKDWRVPDWAEIEDETPPQLINIFRPHGEAIVAALSVTIPGVYYHPDDADRPEDIEAARAYRSITELLNLHNEASMQIVKLITILFCNGTAFGYNYYHEDKRFGTIEKPRVEAKDVEIFEAYCPQCGEGLDGGIPSEALPNYTCQTCGYQGPAQINQSVTKIPQIVGFDHSPKGSICQDLFSGMQVKVSSFARKQEDCGYLLLDFVQSVAMLRSIFQDKAKEIRGGQYTQDEDSFSKIPPQYLGQIPSNAANVSCLWLRPWQFWELGTSEENIEFIQLLLKEFPDGLYAIFVNDVLMDVYAEDMDEHWTISPNPLGDYIYGKPLSENLATLQDIRADLVEIELQTASHGIPETFADPRVLDFEKYGEGRAKPGMVTSAKPRSGKSLSDAFYTTSTAILSQEIDPLRQHIDTDAQFVVGSFPSVYGGPAVSGSKTASEYSQSRAVALQRLGLVWKIVCTFWAKFQARSATEYASVLKDLGQDEKFTKREGDTSINVWIRSTSLSGKIGRVEPESSEQLPSSWAQKKDSITQLLMSGIPEILMVLTHPRNATLMKEAVGLQDLYIPTEEDRTRQFKEFSILSQGIPVPTNPYDNDGIHLEVLSSILEGPAGDELEPQAKQVVLMHLQEHQDKLASKAASLPQGEGEKENSGPPAPGNRPMKKENNVPS